MTSSLAFSLLLFLVLCSATKMTKTSVDRSDADNSNGNFSSDPIDMQNVVLLQKRPSLLLNPRLAKPTESAKLKAKVLKPHERKKRCLWWWHSHYDEYYDYDYGYDYGAPPFMPPPMYGSGPYFKRRRMLSE